jgi:hypothetical protein
MANVELVYCRLLGLNSAFVRIIRSSYVAARVSMRRFEGCSEITYLNHLIYPLPSSPFIFAIDTR